MSVYTMLYIVEPCIPCMVHIVDICIPWYTCTLIGHAVIPVVMKKSFDSKVFPAEPFQVNVDGLIYI